MHTYIYDASTSTSREGFTAFNWCVGPVDPFTARQFIDKCVLVYNLHI